MGMTPDDLAALLTFYKERLGEDEAVARRNIGDAPGTVTGLGDTEDSAPMWPDYQTYDGDDLTAASDYINRFRPLRELREIAAKRAFLAWYADSSAAESYLNVIKANATAWNDHTDYRAAWAPPHYHAEQAT